MFMLNELEQNENQKSFYNEVAALFLNRFVEKQKHACWQPKIK